MKLKKVNHIGIAVKSIDAVREFYENVLGLQCEGEEIVESQKVKVAFYPLGEVRLELLEPTTPDSPVAKFLEKNGEGVHHIAFETDNLQEALLKAKEAGVRLIDETPRVGAHHMNIAFLHPKSTYGVLTEFCAPQDSH